jgi:hypothetical protein
VSFGYDVARTTSTSAVFNATNGSYSFAIAVAGYTAEPGSGVVLVHGAPSVQALVFTPGTPSTFGVTFTESGLPSGTLWSVTVDGVTNLSAAPTLGFEVPPGAYRYVVGAVAHFAAGSASGVGNAPNVSVNRSIGFMPQPAPVAPASGARSPEPDAILGAMLLAMIAGALALVAGSRAYQRRGAARRRRPPTE